MTALALSPLDAHACQAGPARPARGSGSLGRLMRVIIMLSLVDLCVTLGYMKTIGMYEANPLVTLLAGCAYPATAIILLKLASAGVSVGVLHWFRATVSARVAAWVILGLLVMLMVHWVRYSLVVAALGPLGLEGVTGAAGWVSL